MKTTGGLDSVKHKDLMVFEGTMCCDTGICGPQTDRTLIEFSETMKQLKKEYPDVKIQRANMSSNLNVFIQNPDILKLVKEKGIGILPLTRLDGAIISEQKYMSHEELKTALDS
jgi:hypothetical protein